jgi:penicillin-binding protein 2
MATHDVNLADRRGNLVESYKGYDPRVVFFYFLAALLLLVLVGGLAYQQLFRTTIHNLTERTQNQRRILVPGPRGNIYDRNHQLLVGNRHRFAVVLQLDELKLELRREHVRIHNNYLATVADKKDVPVSYSQLEQLARVAVVQRYLDQVNSILRREARVDAARLRRHFDRELLLPYTLLDDLTPEDFARLTERLPVVSPLMVYVFNTRFYPHGSTAAHTLGYVRPNDEIIAEDFAGEDLMTFKMKGTAGIGGLERQFDTLLQGEAGGSIVRVDPAGYKVSSPDLPHRHPKQGSDLTTSLDLDLQLAAEEALGDQTGAAVALDVTTGEVLTLASKPDYNLNEFSPRASEAVVADMNTRGAWLNLALNGLYPPGSTFKLAVSIAGLRSGRLDPDDDSIDCQGFTRIGTSVKGCDNGDMHHGHLKLFEAIAKSCDIYFYQHGIMIGPNVIATEARRFHLDQPTGIELPGETKGMIIPDPAWRKKRTGEGWTDGNTANMSIGQGDVQVTPLEMACFVASLARGETTTQPTLVHDPNRAPQHSEPIGLTPEQRAVILAGMKGVITIPGGTAYQYLNLSSEKIPGVSIAGKTGTAQYGNHLNVAWFVCFAPADNPEIAVAVAIRSDVPGEGYGGGRYAAPVANAVLKKYFEKKNRPNPPLFTPFKAE